MKMNKLIIIIAATIMPTVSLMSNTVKAAGPIWSGEGQYGDYSNNWSKGFTFKIAGITPPNCPGSGDPTQFYVPWSDTHSKQLYALVLTAIATGRKITANYECGNDGDSPPHIFAVTHNIAIK